MDYIQITKENIDKEHICCAMSGKQSLATKEWLKQRFEDPAYYVNEKVRGEALRQFGYFMTESTGHLSEYLPYFRKNAELIRRYTPDATDGVAFQTATRVASATLSG